MFLLVNFLSHHMYIFEGLQGHTSIVVMPQYSHRIVLVKLCLLINKVWCGGDKILSLRQFFLLLLLYDVNERVLIMRSSQAQTQWLELQKPHPPTSQPSICKSRPIRRGLF